MYNISQTFWLIKTFDSEEMRFKMNLSLLTVFLVGLMSTTFMEAQRYEPNWNSLDSRPLPAWYDNGKIGIFLHWGLYSVPAFYNEWFWSHMHAHNKEVEDFMHKNYPPGFKYEDFAPLFKAEHYNPNDWAELFRKSGAKYVVLTTKHHDGYTLWPSKHSPNWNVMDVGPKRDLVGDLAKAVKSHDLKFGVYHSLLEWYNPLCLADKKNNWNTHVFAQTKVRPELEDLINRYEPSLIWSDGTWEATDTYWNSTGILSWLYNDSPVKHDIVVNDRWGVNTECKHGGYWNCRDRYLPDKMINHKWENAMTLNNGSWAYRKDSPQSHYTQIDQLLATMIHTVAYGGNILIDIGPTADGLIVHFYSDVLLQMGQWLQVNGEAIYESKPWKHQRDSVNKDLYYTERAGHVYGLMTTHPTGGHVEFGDIPFESVKSVSLLGHNGQVAHTKNNHNHLSIDVSHSTELKHALVFRFELKQ